MSGYVGESTSAGSSGNAAGGSFECNICFELPQEPIVTLCGHLFCKPCLYRWLHAHAHSPECPVCKALIEEDELVPLYGCGTNRVDPRSNNMHEADIPHHPTGQMPATAPQTDANNNNFAYANANPSFMGTGVPLVNARRRNYAPSAALGGPPPMLSFQVNGFPNAATYAQPAVFQYGSGNGHSHGHEFHGGHMRHNDNVHRQAPMGQQQNGGHMMHNHNVHRQGPIGQQQNGGHMRHNHNVHRQAPMEQQQQVDDYLKGMLITVVVLVIASLLAF